MQRGVLQPGELPRLLPAPRHRQLGGRSHPSRAQALTIIKVSLSKGSEARDATEKGLPQLVSGQAVFIPIINGLWGVQSLAVLPDGAQGRPSRDVVLKSQSVSEPPTAATVVSPTLVVITLRFEENDTAVYWHCQVIAPCPHDKTWDHLHCHSKTQPPQDIAWDTPPALQREGEAQEQRSVPQLVLTLANGHWDSQQPQAEAQFAILPSNDNLRFLEEVFTAASYYNGKRRALSLLPSLASQRCDQGVPNGKHRAAETDRAPEGHCC